VNSGREVAAPEAPVVFGSPPSPIFLENSGSTPMHEPEVDRLRKLQVALLLAAYDRDQTAAAAEDLEQDYDQYLAPALEAAIAEYYTRTFTPGRSTVPYLGAEYAPPAGSPDATLHDILLEAQNTVDAVLAEKEKRGRTRPRLFDRRLLPRIVDLCERQAQRFRAEAGQVQMQLDAADTSSSG
jgi:hypothetical protein